MTRAKTPRGTGSAAGQTIEAKVDARAEPSDVETESHPGHWVNPTAGRVLFGYDPDGWLDRRYDFRPHARELNTSLIKRYLEPAFGHVPVTTQHWCRRFRSAAEAVGQTDLHFHDLRHLAGTLAAATGAFNPELMARLDRSTPRAALTYQHATEELDHQIAAGVDHILEAAKRAPTGSVVRIEQEPQRHTSARSWRSARASTNAAATLCSRRLIEPERALWSSARPRPGRRLDPRPNMIS